VFSASRFQNGFLIQPDVFPVRFQVSDFRFQEVGEVLLKSET
jgi:hypothetical protein